MRIEVILVLLQLICGAPRLWRRRRRLPIRVEEMAGGEDRMPPEHARAGVTHDRFDLFPDVRLVAVDRAFGAGRFGFCERAALQAHCGIVKQSAAFGAQGCPRTMHAPAVADDHGFDRLAFSLQPPV